MRLMIPALLFIIFTSPPLYGQEIKIYTWDYYLSDQVLRIFSERTGHSVKQYIYDDEVARDAILVNGQAGKYDLVIVDSANTLVYTKMGLFAPLSSLKLKNSDNNSKKSRQACGNHAVPLAQGTLGIAYRSSLSDEKIDSWRNLLHPPVEHRGSTMMLKNDIDTVAVALLAEGLNPFTNIEDELKSAYESLKKQSQYLLSYGHPLNYVAEHGNASKLTMTTAYAGDLQYLVDLTGQNDWKYVVPNEGTLFFTDCFIAPTGKPVSQGVKAFLEFINEPYIAYVNAKSMRYATTNEASLLEASEEYKNDKELFPDSQTLQRSYHYKILPKEEIIIRNRMVSMLSLRE